VAVDLGPGLFTGLRVGVAAAKGLAQGLGIGVVGLSSLDILLRAAAQHGHTGHVVAAVDARRGEVFACVRELRADRGPAEDGAHDVIAAGLFAPEELAAALSKLGGVRIVGVGDGAQRYAGVLGDVPGVSCLLDALDAPPPLTLLTMAAELVEAGTAPVAPHLVVPQYMREADATSNFAQVTPA
jgi:tRNA threonylcarbamoyladenosine biosynthesis protein TsaB